MAHISFIAVAAFATMVSQVSAQTSRDVTVALEIRNLAAAPDTVLDGAMRGVRAIFDRANIGVESDEPFQIGGRRSLLVIVTDKRPKSRLASDPLVLGLAAEGVEGRGVIAYVFYDRALQYARRHSLPLSVVIAHVIAHEVGHLLLPRPSHADTGIMKGAWTTIDLMEAQAGRFSFLPEQSESMRRYLSPARPPEIDGEMASN